MPGQRGCVRGAPGAAIRCKTISSSEPGEPTVDRSEMLRLHAHLEQSFPRVHTALTRRVVNEYSLLYEWRGSADASELPYSDQCTPGRRAS